MLRWLLPGWAGAAPGACGTQWEGLLLAPLVRQGPCEGVARVGAQGARLGPQAALGRVHPLVGDRRATWCWVGVQLGQGGSHSG